MMQITTRFRSVLLVTMFGTAVAFAQGAPKADEPTASSLHEVMQKSAQKMQAMKMTGDVDHDFVMAMRDHHMDGIEMAKVALAQGKDAQAKAFAKRIIQNQTKEIKELDAWLAKHHPDNKSGAKNADGHKH